MNDEPNSALPDDVTQAPTPPQPEASEEQVASSPARGPAAWRTHLWALRGAIAVSLASLILGGIGGFALGRAGGDSRQDRFGGHFRGGMPGGGVNGQLPGPGFGQPGQPGQPSQPSMPPTATP